jgi:small subunit ribosomal protein S5
MDWENLKMFLRQRESGEDAKKKFSKIPLNGPSVPHEQKGKFGGRVFLIPSHGTGVIAGGAVRSVLESVGIHDVLSKSQGSSNPHNVVKATLMRCYK